MGPGRETAVVKVEFVTVGRQRREWMWKARDEDKANTITISGQRFESLGEALRDAREQIDGLAASEDDDLGPYAA
jgi:hypothetical protein